MKRLILLLALFTCASSFSVQGAVNPSIDVTGYAEMEIQPNRFVVSIILDERDSKGKITIKEQERKMIAALRGVGIDVDSALRLADTSIDYYRRGVSLGEVYYELTLTKVQDLTDAFRALEPLGLSSVQLSEVTNTDIEKYLSELRRAAIVNARNRADDLATAIGQSVGLCTYISDYRSGNSLDFNMAKSRSERVEYAVVEVASEVYCNMEFRSEKLKYTVQAKFELLP